MGSRTMVSKIGQNGQQLANYFMLGRVYCMVSIGTHEVYRATKMCE